ncbi:MAG: hypothetical protein Q7T07_12475 [Burkholderiaceae bacterium]|nr:hypothetical protein [Burkholderiaceae bacterium]
MNASTHLGEFVPLYQSMPQQLVDRINSADFLRAISSAADVADRSIAALNKERMVRTEDLHQPITL